MKIGKETQFHQKFRSRVEYLLQHMELVMVAIRTADTAIAAAKSAAPDGFKNAMLATVLSPESSSELRMLGKLPVRNWRAFRTFSEKKNLEYTLHLIYAYFEEYVYSVRESLPESLAKYPKAKWAGQMISADELVGSATPDLDGILGRHVKKSIEKRRSGREALEQIVEECGLAVNKDKQGKALLALDVRNVIVHGGKAVTQKMVQRNRGLVKSILNLEAGDAIKLAGDKVLQLIDFISEHLKDVDGSLIKNGVLDARG